MYIIYSFLQNKKKTNKPAFNGVLVETSRWTHYHQWTGISSRPMTGCSASNRWVLNKTLSLVSFTSLQTWIPSGLRKEEKKIQPYFLLSAPYLGISVSGALASVAQIMLQRVTEGGKSAYEHKSRLQSCITDSTFLSLLVLCSLTSCC